MNDYNEVLTDQEVRRVVANYLQTDNANPDKIQDILDLLAFYGQCKMVFEGVISGDFVITGVSENGIEYRSSSRTKKFIN